MTGTPRAKPGLLKSLLPGLVLCGLFYAAAVPLILSGMNKSRGATDQLNYHEPAILLLAQRGVPSGLEPDIWLSATTPLYHIMLAGAISLVGDSAHVLQLVGSVFTAGLLIAVAALCARRLDAPRPLLTAFALTLPIAASIYVFSAGAWLLPDNAAWLMAVGVVAVSLRKSICPAWAAFGLLAMTLLVLFRQSHLWAAAMLWAAAWIGRSASADDTEPPLRAQLLNNFGSRFGLGLVGLSVTLPAFAIVGFFAAWWGGLVAPPFQNFNAGVSPAAPAIILAQAGIIGTFFVGWLLQGIRTLISQHRALLMSAIAIGVLAALMPETTYDPSEGRSSGLWNLVKIAPTIGRTSLVVVALAPVGSVAITAWMIAQPWRDRWVFIAGVLGFVAAMSATSNAWVRYHEPWLLILAAVMSAGVVRTESAAVRMSRWLGPIALAGMLAAANALSLDAGPPKDLRRLLPGQLHWPEDFPGTRSGLVTARWPTEADLTARGRALLEAEAAAGDSGHTPDP
ncbi:MAG: hypothetical protein AAF747_01795 [Planctomycetota bacterium]